MNPPPFKTRLLGHAVVFLPMSAVALGTVGAVIVNHDVWPMLLVVAWPMNISIKANQQVAAYKAWKRAWDSMAPDAPPPRQRRPQRGLALALFGLLAAYLALTQDQPGHTLALGWMATIAMVAITLATAGTLRRRRRAKPRATPPVRICVTRPLLRVPTLRDAYAALPPYCLQLLGGRP